MRDAAHAAAEAIAQVRAGATEQEKDRLAEALCRTVSAMTEFTTAEVWHEYDERGWERPREPRVMGAIMREAAAAGLCKKTDRVRESGQERNHNRPLAIWIRT